MADEVSIHPAGESDFDALTDVWERAARPNHLFMSDDDIAEMRPRIRDLHLPSMDVFAAHLDDEPVGFIGVRDDHVELLYIVPEAQGRRIGTTLLAHVGDPRSVEVYADNVAGLGFYLSQGFRVTRQDPTDAGGHAFPIAHLER